MGKKIDKKTHQKEEANDSDDGAKSNSSSDLEAPPKKETTTRPENPENQQIFVSGIPYETTEAELREFFNQGDVQLKDKITEVKLPRYQDSGKCRGFAHVAFSDSEAYNLGLTLTGKSLGPRYLELKPAAGRQSIATQEDSKKIAESMPEDCKTIFVKNLPYSFKEDDIGDRFRPFGEINEIRMGMNWQTN